MEKTDFRVMVRRVPGYEPTVSLRFEMHEGYGELHVGERRRASPSALGEVAEVGGEAVRGGRFVHVLASGRRRQSYAFSRLDDDRLQRLPDDKWVELTPVTEFGIRYLDLPALEAASSVVAVQLSASPTPARADTPATAASTDSALLSRARSRSASTGSAAASVSPAAPRAATASPTARAAAPVTASVAAPGSGAATRSPPPARVASPVDPGATTLPTTPPAARGVSVSPALGQDAVASLTVEQLREHLLAEMAKVEALHQALADAERRLMDSQDREQDLVGVIQRWSERG